MAQTLLLDLEDHDLVLDASGNIAVASAPYSLAQDAGCALRLFRGEAYWDTTVGVPYLTELLGKRPNVPLMKTLFEAAAETVDGVATAQVLISDINTQRRSVSGQVQVYPEDGGDAAAVTFTVIDPQGG